MKHLVARFLNRVALIAPGGYRLRPMIHRWRGAKIGANTWISQFVFIDELHPEGIEIGKNCTIGIRSSIITHLYWGPRRQGDYGPVVIEDDVYLGPHCVVLPNVRIGKGAVIRAGTVVASNVPPQAFWGTQPARPLGWATVPLASSHTYEGFVKGLRPFRPGSQNATATPRTKKDAESGSKPGPKLETESAQH